MHMKIRMNQRLFCSILVASLVTTGCSADKKADAAQPKPRKEGSVAPRTSVVSTPTGEYRATTVTGGSRLTGTVDFDGPIPPDSIVPVPADMIGCGQSVRVTPVTHSGTHIGGAVVWITDIRTGKPLPIGRRFDLANSDCLLTPSVQGVLSPATLNMASEDVAIHRNRIIDVATGDLEAIAPFNDNGEVVPFDKLLTRPAQLEVTCDLHPWSKATILVFDHPYFATTQATGTFAIEDVPAGTYHVRAYHPRLGLAEQQVTIAAGQPAALSFKLPGSAADSAQRVKNDSPASSPSSLLPPSPNR
jgi:hypothetical protein